MNNRSSFNKEIVGEAIRDSFRKLNPKVQMRNPVMFIVFIGALITTGITLRDMITGAAGSLGFAVQITLWLWFTVLFANFAEAIAEEGVRPRPRLSAVPVRRPRQTWSMEMVQNRSMPLACVKAMSC